MKTSCVTQGHDVHVTTATVLQVGYSGSSQLGGVVGGVSRGSGIRRASRRLGLVPIVSSADL